VSHDEKEQIPVIRVSIQRPFQNGAALVLETYIPQDAPLPRINDIMDKLAGAGDRQLQRSELEREEQLVYNDEIELARQVDGLDDMDRLYAHKIANEGGNRRSGYKLTENEQKAREGCVRGIDMLQKRLAAHRQRVADLKRDLGLLKQAAE
jgi:hypothetical protein